VVAYVMNAHGWLGGTTSTLYVLPWFGILGGLWRAAVGLLSR
jgi:uncharacterized membrane protein